MEEKITRKLTTILAADVEGYSRLMRADEEATLKTLGEYREIFDGLIARHDGRVFSTGGDSVLAEFGSAVEAARAVNVRVFISSWVAALCSGKGSTHPTPQSGPRFGGLPRRPRRDEPRPRVSEAPPARAAAGDNAPPK